MIIAESNEHYRMITQNDHGDLAGQFAAHWGNEEFARLKPYQSDGSGGRSPRQRLVGLGRLPVGGRTRRAAALSPELPAKLDRASTAEASTTSLAAISTRV